MTKFRREDARVETIAKLAHCAPHGRQELIEEYARMSEEAFAPETMRNFRQITGSFMSWCERNDHDPTPPVDPRIVSEYVEQLGGKLSSNTIETRLWAIAELHRSRFVPSPCQHPFVQLALKGVKRKYGVGRKQAPPLGKEDVLRLVRSMGTDRLSLRDRALIWTASDSWCRVSELVAFRVCDLMRQSDGSSLLYIARSKTDQFGEGAFAYLSEEGTDAVLAWIECAGLRDADPLFTKSQPGAQRTPLAPATVSRMLKRRFCRKDVSPHSMRVGGVHDAFRLGCSLSSIMVAGRWTSPEMPARYGRRILASQSAAAEVSRAFARTEPAAETEG